MPSTQETDTNHGEEQTALNAGQEGHRQESEAAVAGSQEDTTGDLAFCDESAALAVELLNFKQSGPTAQSLLRQGFFSDSPILRVSSSKQVRRSSVGSALDTSFGENIKTWDYTPPKFTTDISGVASYASLCGASLECNEPSLDLRWNRQILSKKKAISIVGRPSKGSSAELPASEEYFLEVVPGFSWVLEEGFELPSSGSGADESYRHLYGLSIRAHNFVVDKKDVDGKLDESIKSIKVEPSGGTLRRCIQEHLDGPEMRRIKANWTDTTYTPPKTLRDGSVVYNLEELKLVSLMGTASWRGSDGIKKSSVKFDVVLNGDMVKVPNGEASDNATEHDEVVNSADSPSCGHGLGLGSEVSGQCTTRSILKPSSGSSSALGKRQVKSVSFTEQHGDQTDTQVDLREIMGMLNEYSREPYDSQQPVSLPSVPRQ